MNESPAKIKQRSNAYPSITLAEASEIVAAIHRNYGKNHLVSREDIASILKLSSATIQTKISSCAQYGVLEKSHGEGYKPSDLSIRITKPLSEQEKLNAQIEALSRPKLYAELILQYNNHALPNSLPTILSRNYGIADAAAPKAAEIFIQNLSDLNFIDENRILKIGTIVLTDTDEIEPKNAFVQKEGKGTATIVQPVYVPPNDDFRNIDIGLSGKNRKAVLRIPNDITAKDMSIIKAQLTVIELAIETESTA